MISFFFPAPPAAAGAKQRLQPLDHLLLPRPAAAAVEVVHFLDCIFFFSPRKQYVYSRRWWRLFLRTFAKPSLNFFGSRDEWAYRNEWRYRGVWVLVQSSGLAFSELRPTKSGQNLDYCRRCSCSLLGIIAIFKMSSFSTQFLADVMRGHRIFKSRRQPLYTPTKCAESRKIFLPTTWECRKLHVRLPYDNLTTTKIVRCP